MLRPGDVFDWLESRTGLRSARKHLLDEPIPAGVGWWFVTGSVILLLLTVQIITGIVLAMYYVPSPEFAYDSIRYLVERERSGPIVRRAFFAPAHRLAGDPHARVVAGRVQEASRCAGNRCALLLLPRICLTGYRPWDQKSTVRDRHAQHRQERSSATTSPADAGRHVARSLTYCSVTRRSLPAAGGG